MHRFREVPASALGSVCDTEDTALDCVQPDPEDGCVASAEQMRVEQISRIVPVYYCWACSGLSLRSTGICRGTNHQLRRSRCDSVRVSEDAPVGLNTIYNRTADWKQPISGRPAKYKDYRTGEEAETLRDSIVLLREKASRMLRLKQEKKAICERMDKLKERLQSFEQQHDFATRELENEMFGC